MTGDIDFRFIDDPGEAAQALTDLAAAEELAIDLEADSLHSYDEKICLVQLSIPGANIVIDPLSCASALPRLGEILADRSVLKVFHGGDYDIRLLKKGHGFEVGNLFDTMVAAQFASREKFGLAPLLEKEFDVILDKKYQRADWSKRPLSPEMLHYAALDTACLLALKERLENDLLRLDRLSWVREEFGLLENIVPAEDRSPSAYNVKGAGRLSPRSRGLLQRLLLVRDAAARDLDRPPFKVLSNGLLIELAVSPPQAQADILDLPGASRRILARLAPRLFDALHRPLEPEEILPPRGREHNSLSPEQKKALGELKKCRNAMEEHLGLPPGLLANSATLEKLCRMEPQEAALYIETDFKNWQRDVAGERFMGILASLTDTV